MEILSKICSSFIRSDLPEVSSATITIARTRRDGPSHLNATALIVAIRTTKWRAKCGTSLSGADLDAEIQLAANVACRVMTTDDEDAPKSAKILQFRNRRCY